MSGADEAAQLARFAALVRRWSGAINLVSARDLAQLEARHIADSRDIVRSVEAPDGPWCDLGSGGGFPGIVAGILLPGTEVTLIEADARKATFLRQAAHELALGNVRVITARIEAAPPQGALIVSARALAPMCDLLPLVHRHLAEDGRAVLPKGRKWREEVEVARKGWAFRCDARPSPSDPEAAILHLSELRPA